MDVTAAYADVRMFLPDGDLAGVLRDVAGLLDSQSRTLAAVAVREAARRLEVRQGVFAFVEKLSRHECIDAGKKECRSNDCLGCQARDLIGSAGERDRCE